MVDWSLEFCDGDRRKRVEEEDKRPEKKQRVEGISEERETPEEPALGSSCSI